jgi:hypothetical protein
MPIYKGTNEITSGNLYKGLTKIENGYKQLDPFYVNTISVTIIFVDSISGATMDTTQFSAVGTPGAAFTSFTRNISVDAGRTFSVNPTVAEAGDPNNNVNATITGITTTSAVLNVSGTYPTSTTNVTLTISGATTASPVPVAPVPAPAAPVPQPTPVPAPAAPVAPQPVPQPTAPVAPQPVPQPVPAPVTDPTPVPQPIPIPIPVPQPTAPVAPACAFISLRYSNSGGNNACNNSSTAYYTRTGGFSSMTSLFSDSNCTTSAPIGYYNFTAAQSCSAPTPIPIPIPIPQPVPAPISAACYTLFGQKSSNTVCSGSYGQYYFNGSTLFGSTVAYQTSACNSNASAGYYTIGGMYRYWNGSSFSSAGSC